MSRFFRIQVDEAALTDELFSFVTDPHPSRNDRPVVDELHDVAPDVVDVLECMIIDGVDDRRFVADYVQSFVHELSA